MPPVPAELLDYRVRAAWYAVLPQRVVGRLAHTLATRLPQTAPEGRAAVELLACWLRGKTTSDECRVGAEAAWAAAVREWERAAPLMDSVTWDKDNGADDPRAPGDALAAAASAVETTMAKYAEAASRADSYAAAILGWPEVRHLLEQELGRVNEA